jgi:TRAP-type C4-dicarboxylate transport system substrate-binding protein
MKTKTLYSIALVALLLISTGGVAVSKTTVIKIATLAPEGSTWTEIFNGLNAELKTATNNGVRLKIYPGGVLGNEKDMIRKMFVGQIHGSLLTSAGLSTIFDEMDVFQIPFLFNTYDEVDYVLKKMDGFFKKGFADKGYILPSWSEGGFIRMMSTQPIASLDDLRKAKIWTWEDAPMAKAIFYEAGISAFGPGKTPRWPKQSFMRPAYPRFRCHCPMCSWPCKPGWLKWYTHRRPEPFLCSGSPKLST